VLTDRWALHYYPATLMPREQAIWGELEVSRRAYSTTLYRCKTIHYANAYITTVHLICIHIHRQCNGVDRIFFRIKDCHRGGNQLYRNIEAFTATIAIATFAA
jgi:hypothetical protein